MDVSILLIVVVIIFCICLAASGRDETRRPAAYRTAYQPPRQLRPQIYQQARHYEPHSRAPPLARAYAAGHAQRIPGRAFHLFIQELVERFKGQRKKQQFAVLFLASQEDFSRMKFRTGTGVVSGLNPATNNSYATYPFDHNLCNFVTARPEGPHHAEALLMGKFNALMSSYREQGMPPYRCIVVYTWLLPCRYCKRQILQTLASQTQRYEVILVYTTKMPDISVENERDIVSTLERNGISVRCESYDRFLPALE